MNLIYTVAYDLPGWRGARTMSKLLASSLLRGFWSGELMMFRNFAQPLFPVERKGVDEVFVETPDPDGGEEAGKRCLREALEMRFRAVERIDRPWLREGDQFILVFSACPNIHTSPLDYTDFRDEAEKVRGAGGHFIAGERDSK